MGNPLLYVQKLRLPYDTPLLFFNRTPIHILRCFALSMKRPSQSHRPIATPVFLACPLNLNPLTLCPKTCINQ